MDEKDTVVSEANDTTEVNEVVCRVAPEIKMPKTKAEMHALYMALTRNNTRPVGHPEEDRGEFFDYYSAWKNFEEHRQKMGREEQSEIDFAQSCDKIEKLMIVYCNVGQMPPHLTENFIEQMKEKLNLKTSRLPDGYEVIWIPTRTTDTHIEVIEL
jgi:hypothetical protein